MKNILDFSFSGIVNYIDTDIEKASELINTAAILEKENKKNIEDLEKQLRILQNERDILLEVPNKVAKHLNKELPFYVIRINKVIKVDYKEFTITQNFI